MIGKYFKRFSNRNSLRLVLTAYLVTLGYVLISFFYDRVGFPLDDAWIHQTYARNLVSGYGWSFIPGTPSAGSTSPLWTLLLSAGHYLGVQPVFWAVLLGAGILGACGMVIYEILKVDRRNQAAFIVSLFFILEWHFVWAAVSGMETILCVLLALLLFWSMQNKPAQGIWSGVVAALSIWVRPDLITMLVPVGLLLMMNNRNWKARIKECIICGSIVGLSLIGYMVFNYSTSGLIMPTTFYAKQSEYAELRQLPFLIRYFREFQLALIGVGILLFPGYLNLTLTAISQKRWLELSFSVWYMVYVGIYGFLLPVTYQHGRYMIPAMGIYFLLGVIGSINLAEYIQRNYLRWGWVIRTSWKVSFVLISVSFLGMGGWTYAKDVSFIEREMVDTAIWINKNVPDDSLLAVHDIGAMGYFGQRKILDLAGLINPEVIPFIRDEEKIRQYLNSNQVDILVCFPGWYPQLTKDLEILYQGQRRNLRAEYDESMTVYLWRVDKSFR